MNNNWKVKGDGDESSSSPSTKSRNGGQGSNRPQYHKTRSYGGEYYARRSNSGESGGNKTKKMSRKREAVLKVQEATGGYFNEIMIENILKQNDFDVGVCIGILEEGKVNSWSNVVAPHYDDMENIKKEEKSTKTKKK